MSPQSRVSSFEINAACLNVDGDRLSCNVCPSNVFSDDTWDGGDKSSLGVHQIRDSSSDVDTSSPGTLGKRGSDFISTASSSSGESSQQFLSSYGSAFLSGIFADIAEAGSGNDESSGRDSSCSDSYERLSKKSRPSNPALFGGHRTKSLIGFDGLMDGAVVPPSSAMVSPRSRQSSQMKIKLFNDQVRELQDLTFPSLPGLPAAVSSSSCTTATVGAVVTPRDLDSDQDQESFGWFVATDDDDASNEETTTAPMFLPLPKPSFTLPPPAVAAPPEENADVEVQQALAADTIDDVLGDLF